MVSNSLKSVMKGLLFGALFFSYESKAADWKDKQWLRLLHYEKSLFGKYLSEVDGPNFFLSPNGSIRPDKELAAFKKALKENPINSDDHAYCRFPARWRWLKKQQPDLKQPEVTCPKLNAFRARLAAKSISIVFSSYYMGNPASSFGHTFIRVGKNAVDPQKSSTTSELLDVGVNFGAVTGDAGAVAYALGGLTGLFIGTFNAIPYYYKVREYNDYETRDLWSYQLDLTQEEIDFVVDHVWELGATHFDYYFLTENCSYHMMTILEAVRPDVNLLQHLPGFYIIPSDTLQALEKEKLIRSVTFRPAPSALFDYLISKTTAEEKKLVNQVIADPKMQLPISDERKVLVYDAAIGLVDFKYAKEILKDEPEAQKIKQPLLIARSKVPSRSEEPDFSFKLSDAPHLGHESRRYGLAVFNLNDEIGTEFKLRFAFHDLLDYPVAYPKKTRLEVGNVVARTFGEDLQLREVILADAMSLGDWTMFTHSSSWKIRLGQWQTRRDRRDFSTQGFLAGYGYSIHTKYFTPYVLAHGETSYISELYRKIKLGAGTDVGFVFDFTESFKMNSALEWRVRPWNETRVTNELRKTSKDFGAGLYFNNYLENGDHEFGLNLYLYLL